MTSVETLDKKFMYRSHGPNSSGLFAQPRELKHSALQVNSNIVNQGKFRYERVDNMFKLV